MAKKTITVSLNARDIERAMRELDAYKKEFLRKVDELRHRVATYIATNAQAGFDTAIADDLLPGSWGPRPASVIVNVRSEGEVEVVVASGEDAVFVEFGAGVYHNGPVGSSPNPWGNDLGYTIGSYGPNGAKEVWGYRDESGELKLTHGTPAGRPLFNAVQAAIQDISSMVKEVFG